MTLPTVLALAVGSLPGTWLQEDADPPPDQKGRQVLDAMVEATRSLKGLRARSRVTETTSRGRSYPHTSSIFWDPGRSRLLCRWGYEDAPFDHRSILVEGEQCTIVDHILSRRCQLDRTPRTPDEDDWTLEERLGLAAVDELWKISFTGVLHLTAAAAAGATPVHAQIEEVEGRSCDRIDWEGSECRLWVDREDHLPRRFEGWALPVRGSRSKEHWRVEVLSLEIVDFEADAVEFVLPTGLTSDSPEVAHKKWPWLRRTARDHHDPGNEVPEFSARTLNGTVRGSEHLPDRCLLVFWFSPSRPCRDSLVALDRELAALPAPPQVIAIHHGKLPEDPDRFVPPARLELWSSPVDSRGAHRSFGVYRCPRFVLIEDGRIDASTRSLEEMRNHLDG